MTDTKLIEKLQAPCNEHVDNIGFIINEMEQGNKKIVQAFKEINAILEMIENDKMMVMCLFAHNLIKSKTWEECNYILNKARDEIERLKNKY